MKDYYIFQILLYLNNHRKTTASKIANKFHMSTRSVYRYIDDLSLIGVPVITKTGKMGGIEILKNFCIDGIMLAEQEKIKLQKYAESYINDKEIINILKKITNIV